MRKIIPSFLSIAMLGVPLFSFVSCNTEQESHTVCLDSKALYNSRIAKQVRLSLKKMQGIYTHFVLDSGETLLSISDKMLKERVEAKGAEKGMLAPIMCLDSRWHKAYCSKGKL